MVPYRDRSHRDGKRDSEESDPLKNPLLPLRAVITGIKLETEDVRTYSILLDGVLNNPKPGQFNMVGYPGVGESPISLSSVVSNSRLQHTIKSVGRVTGFIERLKEGDEIFLRGPYGSSWPLNEAIGEDILLIAGGVGLAPIRPAIQEILSKRDSFGSVTLVYGVRSPADILFRDEIDLWRQRIAVLLTVDEVPSNMKWDYNIGLVTELLDKVALNPERTFAFVCGPEIMMRFVSRGLFLRGFPPSKIYVSLERRMRCGIAQCGHCQHGGNFACKDGPVFPYKDVRGLPDSLL